MIRNPQTGRPDYILFAGIGGLVVLGLVILSSASSVVGFERFGDPNYYLKQQFFFGVLVGGSALYILSRVSYHLWRKLAFPLLVVTILLLLAVFLPGLGLELGGARRWISVGSIFLIQPSEIAKLTLILYLAYWLERRDTAVKDFSAGVIPFLVLTGSVALLVLLEPDFGTMALIAVLAFILLFVSGARLIHLAGVLVGAAGALVLFVQVAPYRLARINSFLNPELDPQGIGYHINQALLAIGSGGIFGLGLGRSQQKFNYLPEVVGDSIFAVYAEEFGFILSVLLIALFLLVAIRGFRVARYAPDTFGRLVATGITTWFVFQALVNIAAMVALLPITGIPLPFISYGRSAIVTSLAGAGILLNISRYARVPAPRFTRKR